MKLFNLVLVLCLFSCASAQAGSNGCTNTSSLSWYQNNPYTTLTTSECVINATQADAGNTSANVSLLAYLPSAPSDGDQFTITDQTPYSYDVAEEWYSDPSWGGDGNTYAGASPGGMGFEGYGSATVDGSQSDTLSEFYFTNCWTATPSIDCTPDSSNNLPAGCAACTSAQLPSYWADYPKVRYSYTATYNASTNDWVTTYSHP